MDKNACDAEVSADIYENMLKSALKLRNQIRYKSENDLVVTKVECEFIDNFEAYIKVLFETIDEQENAWGQT